MEYNTVEGYDLSATQSNLTTNNKKKERKNSIQIVWFNENELIASDHDMIVVDIFNPTRWGVTTRESIEPSWLGDIRHLADMMNWWRIETGSHTALETWIAYQITELMRVRAYVYWLFEM